MGIPALRKQFTIVLVDAAFQAETNICFTFKIETFGRALFFSKLLITFEPYSYDTLLSMILLRFDRKEKQFD